MFPNDIVGFRKRDAILSNDQLVERGHEIFDFGVLIHTRFAEIARSDQPHKLSISFSCICHGHRRMTRFLFQSENIGKRAIQRKV